jgi:hypothetical protein
MEGHKTPEPRDAGMQEVQSLPAQNAGIHVPLTAEATLQLSAENQRTLQIQLLEFGKMLLVLDDQNRRLRALVESRLTITAAQARVLNRAVATRAAALCTQNGLDYRRFGRRYRDAIIRDMRKVFAVAALADLPLMREADAHALVAGWESYKLARELRARAGGGGAHA